MCKHIPAQTTREITAQVSPLIHMCYASSLCPVHRWHGSFTASSYTVQAITTRLLVFWLGPQRVALMLSAITTAGHEWIDHRRAAVLIKKTKDRTTVCPIQIKDGVRVGFLGTIPVTWTSEPFKYLYNLSIWGNYEIPAYEMWPLRPPISLARAGIRACLQWRINSGLSSHTAKAETSASSWLHP